MKKNILIGLGVVLVVLLTLYFGRVNKADAPVADVPASSEESSATSTDTTATTSETNSSTPTKPTPSPAPKPTQTQTTPRPSGTSSNLPYSVTVIYDGGRFIPNEVTIIEGGTVRFVNTSETKMWIASDNHPTHTRYPEKSDTSCSGQSFDQCASVLKSGSWSYTFDRVGTWGYHNHERAKDNGSVRVMTKEDYIKESQSGI